MSFRYVGLITGSLVVCFCREFSSLFLFFMLLIYSLLYIFFIYSICSRKSTNLRKQGSSIPRFVIGNFSAMLAVRRKNKKMCWGETRKTTGNTAI